MAKIRKYKLSWEASDSQKITGYKLYWSMTEEVSYDSKFIDVGDATEIILPSDIILSGGPVMIGIAAIDKDGNESDITTLAEPYQFYFPEAPVGLSLIPLDDFSLVEPAEQDFMELPKLDEVFPEHNDNGDPLAEAIESNGTSKSVRTKYYDDVGYRKTT